MNRALLRLVALLLAFGLIAAACGGSDGDGGDAGGDDQAQTDEGGDGGDDEGGDGGTEADEGTRETLPPEEETAVQGGTLTYGLEADVDGLNPTSSALSAPGHLMSNAVFDRLAVRGPDGRAVPFLAESFTPNEDNTSWTIKLREGITFHDGEPFNAEAVQANFEAQRSAALVGLAVRPYYPAPEEGEATEVLSEYEIQFNLKNPAGDAHFPDSMASQLGIMASPAWLEAAAANETLNQEPVGTGPFIFESRTRDASTVFVRNDDWWGGDVWLDRIEFQPVTDTDVRTQRLIENDLEAIHTTTAGNISALRDAEGDGIQNVIEDLGEESFVMINAESPPFDDIRARQALTYATPKDNYLALIGEGVLRSSDQIFPPEHPYYNPDVVQVADDPDQATPLVAEYCAENADQCSDGRINMEFQWSGPSVVQTRIAELLTEGWKDHFNVTFDELLQTDHIQQVALGQFNVVTWRQFGAGEPGRDRVWIACETVDAISLNWPRVCDEPRTDLIDQAGASVDEAERAELWKQISQSLNDAYTYVFLTHTMWDNAFGPNVRGVCENSTPVDDTQILCTYTGHHRFEQIWMAPE